MRFNILAGAGQITFPIYKVPVTGGVQPAEPATMSDIIVAIDGETIPHDATGKCLTALYSDAVEGRHIITVAFAMDERSYVIEYVVRAEIAGYPAIITAPNAYVSLYPEAPESIYDTQLSETSKNALQNKVITAVIGTTDLQTLLTEAKTIVGAINEIAPHNEGAQGDMLQLNEDGEPVWATPAEGTTLDEVPTENSNNGVKSGGVWSFVGARVVFDISAYHATGGVLAKYADLTAALGSNGANVPEALRKGGMSVKFVQSSDNNSVYVQYRYMGTATTGNPNPFLNTANWQGIDEEPSKNSKNLIESGGVYYEVTRLNNKLIKLTGFAANATAAGATEIDDCYFNTSVNEIRIIVGVGNEGTVPFIDGAIYTYNNELYTYNGTTLVHTTQSLIDAVGIINNDIFGISGSLQKDGTVSSTSGFWVTPFIPVTVGETIKVGGYSGGTNYNYSLICIYKADKTTLVGAYGNDNTGFAELEMTIPATAAYMRVGSRNDTSSIAYMSRSYVHAKILSKLTDNLFKAYFSSGENVNDVSIDSVLSNNNHLAKGSAIVAGINTAKDELLEEISNLDEELYGTQTFDNAVLTDTGKITFNAITLHEDGDELDIEVLPSSTVVGTNSGEYAMTFGETEAKIRIGISRYGVTVRANDNSWIYGPGGEGGTGSSKQAYKFKYTSGTIEIWKGTTKLTTYTGQKDISIYGIGSQSMATKWSGIIYRFAYTHDGVTTELLNLTGFTKNDGVTINYVREGGDIPELQAQNYPKFEIHPTTDNVEVYFHLNKDIYGNLPIKHIETNTDTHYANFWGIENRGVDIGYICRYVNGSFVNLTQRLLVGSENEFAIQFYQDDFTGGAHGDERIDLDNTCYVVFIVDGKEYSINELIALGNIQCNSFSYRQRSVLYTRYEDTGTHDPIAYHMKDTEFIEGGYITRNNIEMLQAMTALNTYSGLVCVHKDIADYVVDNTGKVFTATHPSTASVMSGISNKVDMRIRMYKGSASCVLDSKVVGGNVSDFNTAPSNVTIWDRQGDTKYYAVLPTNVSLLATSVFGFETSVRFDYRDDV